MKTIKYIKGIFTGRISEKEDNWADDAISSGIAIEVKNEPVMETKELKTSVETKEHKVKKNATKGRN